MKRLGVLFVAMLFCGCAEFEELMVGDCYDAWYVEQAPLVYPPLAQPTLVSSAAPTPSVVPASFSGTTPEPEMIAPKR